MQSMGTRTTTSSSLHNVMIPTNPLVHNIYIMPTSPLSHVIMITPTSPLLHTIIITPTPSSSHNIFFQIIETVSEDTLK